MGCDKAWVIVPTPAGPQPMLTAVVAQLCARFERVVVVASTAKQVLPPLPPEVVVLLDVDPGRTPEGDQPYQGPVHALAHALRSLRLAEAPHSDRTWPDSASGQGHAIARADRVLICACDNLGLDREVIDRMIETQERETLEWVGVAGEGDDIPQPLPTRWRLGALTDALSRQLKSGSARLRDLLVAADELGHRSARVPGDTSAINDPEQLRGWWRGWWRSWAARRLLDTPGAAKVPAMSITAVVLAAGKGTRMRSELPKVLHPLHGHSLLAWVLHRAASVGVDRTIVIVGHGAEEVRAAMHGSGRVDLEYVTQPEQRGTGHAVACALPQLESVQGAVLILSGDVPLLRSETLEALLAAYRRSAGGFALVAFEPESPTGYGRILTDPSGAVIAIREERDCSEQERLVRTCNAGIYCVDAAILRRELPRLTPHNAAGELYLTDLVEACAGAGIAATTAGPQEVAGVNTPEQLAAMEAEASAELLRDPPTTRPLSALANDGGLAQAHAPAKDSVDERPGGT